MAKDIYDFEVEEIDKTLTSLKEYQGKVLLILVSALHSQFKDRYREIEFLYRRYKALGFEVLDFPSDDFNGQAYEEIEEIDQILKDEYHTTFHRFNKVKVTGDDRSPLFAFLCKKKKFRGFDKGNLYTPFLSIYHLKRDPLWMDSSDIKWNFTMFLIDKEGEVRSRFEPTSGFSKIEKTVLKLLEGL